ncbi:MAG: thiamine pyrophosphate-dependent dehydrogenase E1 component subunit alpha, partial [Vicinamibacterales bacterium]
DGATSTGLFHETLNMAAVYHAPLVVIIENNQYAYSTPLSQQMKVQDLAGRATVYGVAGARVDGNDVEAVYEASREAVERARNGGGATIIEAMTMRMLGHAVHDGADYVPADLLESWEARDPIRCYAERLVAEGGATRSDLDDIVAKCEREVDDAVAFAEASPWPDPATVSEGVYAR